MTDPVGSVWGPPLPDHSLVMRQILEPELRRVYERLDKNNENTSNVVQYIILVFGVILVAASDRPSAFAFVPVFWTVWMLHSRVIDFNTLKLSLYAARLERELNATLPRPVFFWESRFTQRGNIRPFIFNLNFVYWGVLNGASWIAGIAALIYDHLHVWSTVLACIWVMLWVPSIRDVKSRNAVMEVLKNEVDRGPDVPHEPIVVPSDPLPAHIPLVGGVAAFVAASGAISIWSDDPLTQRLTIAIDVAAIMVLAVLDLAAPGPGRIIGHDGRD